MQISNNRKITGLSEYPDLLEQARAELRNGKGCMECRKNTIIRKYNAKLQQRKREEAIRARIIPHKGAK